MCREEAGGVFAETGVFVFEGGFEEIRCESIEAVESAEGVEAGQWVGGLLGEIF